MIDVEFTGSESPEEIVRATVDEFSRHPHPSDFTIFYENSIPKLRYQFQGGDLDFSCTYRLDTMLVPFYAEAERIFDELAELRAIEVALRQTLVPYIAFTGMTNMLSRLLILQLEIFGENFEEAQVTARGIFLHSLVKTHTGSQSKVSLARGVSKIVRRWIDEAVAASMKNKRDFLVGFINAQPLLHIPTSVGRPTGSTKPEEQKRQEAAEFETKIERTIRDLLVAGGKMPTKTRVAEELAIGGESSRVNAFNNKLRRNGIDYAAIAARVKLHK